VSREVAREGAARTAGWLGLAAAVVPVVEEALIRVRYGTGFEGEPAWLGVVSILLVVLLVVLVPLTGSFLVLRAAAGVRVGLLVLLVFGFLRLPQVLSQAWYVLGVGAPAWYWAGPLLAVAAGGAAAAALGLSALRVGPARFGGGRSLAAGGAVLYALTDIFPSVTVEGLENGAAAVVGAGGLFWSWPDTVFTLFNPLVVLVLAVALLVVPTQEAVRVAATILALFALVDLTYLGLSLAAPGLPDTAIAVGLIAVLDLGAAVLLAVGAAVLRQKAPVDSSV
jgi:hypothetical protein